MNHNFLVKIICSVPVILVVSYFSKILGVLLVIFRLITVRESKYTLPSTLIGLGLIILIPQGLHMINSDIPYVNDILALEIYPKLFSYSKFLLILGVILLMVSYIIQDSSRRINNHISNYVNKQAENDYNISKENDYRMRQKQEESKYTRIIKCPHCGANNTIKDKVGICSHCRCPLE